jgi:methionine synthase II (cobalamin-independent)
MSTEAKADGVHLVGSIPLPDTTSVFRTVCSSLPHRLRRIPDGETGERYYFVWFQCKLFPEAMIRNVKVGEGSRTDIPDSEVQSTMSQLLLPIRTGYDDAALASYATFCTMRDEGVIPKGVRFQVSLPTPLNVMVLIDGQYSTRVEAMYEEALLSALRRIQAEIPAHDLAVQWDCAAEFGMLEGVFFQPWWEGDVQDGVVERILRVAATVDEGVELGFHLCYGDIEHKHFVEPKDTSKLRAIASAILNGVKRKVDWIHLPVPRERDDVAYFEPLKGLDFGRTKLYLGLLHPDGEEATRKRIEAAKQVGLSSFGVSTECGMGRTSREDLESIFQTAVDVTVPVPVI